MRDLLAAEEAREDSLLLDGIPKKLHYIMRLAEEGGSKLLRRLSAAERALGKEDPVIVHDKDGFISTGYLDDVEQPVWSEWELKRLSDLEQIMKNCQGHHLGKCEDGSWSFRKWLLTCGTAKGGKGFGKALSMRKILSCVYVHLW